MRKEKGPRFPHLFLSFHVILFPRSGWLTQGWVRNVIDFRGHWCFLEHHCLLSVWRSSGSDAEWGLWGLSVPRASATDTDALTLQVSSTHTGWAGAALWEEEGKAPRRVSVQISSAPAHALLSHRTSFTKHEFEGTKNFETVTAEHKPGTGLSERGAPVAHHTPVRPTWPHISLLPSPFRG